MRSLFKIAIRNLIRYKRRTLLTASLITIGVVFVLVFVSISGSFKTMITGQITDSMMGHLQIHRKGYVASIDNLPLNLNMKPKAYQKIKKALITDPQVEAFSPRLKFGGMFSNFTETTNIRLNGIDPKAEFKTVPLLTSRILAGKSTLGKGEILIPALLAKGMKIKPGDPVVIVATNADGSVNGKQFIVSGILESATGPGGRDGYVHIEDAAEVLRMADAEISEVAIRLKNFGHLSSTVRQLQNKMAGEVNQQGKPMFEVHSWEDLSPFFNIARMIDVMTLFIRIMLIAIVLISIMNVMIMAVYERIREIGTIAAIGTLPDKIRSMFIIEGFCMGVVGALTGVGIGAAVIAIVNLIGIRFNFGQQKGLLLKATLDPLNLLVVSAIVIAVAVLASLQPAIKASRMEPIDALRHV
ncbi:MAG: Lipoprotein-releasing system transmembrane protein LolE [Deltaproteobacteria bacterium ADurb.Bin151]|jgi:putative ABC transport system permease protein|nr:ABC transporter permease [Smithella sp.]OQB51380.1 MAG: Lipoprotein-releasing system transmembrane protein LolE [Deltaproteobacteria bacterium ADurb.Bin151]HOQ42251.1 ABC transporter permease [Smithellaceae bacterium]HPL68219.1 ABC transporter permease [Smithellaceae bacterium]HQP24239.1 ABC transporter permease [Smithellaceae bacterium]